MAAGVAITIPPWLWLREAWSDLGSHVLSDDQYESTIAQCVTASTAVSTYRADVLGGGFWRITQRGHYFGLTLTSALEDDVLYLVSPDGTVRQYDVIRTAVAMDAPAGNETTMLTDADADFLAEGLTPPPAVLDGDVVVLTASGATARVLGVESETLLTSGLSLHQTFAAGREYWVVRPATTDTREALDLTARPLDWDFAQRWVGDRLLQQVSTQRVAGIGGSATTPPEVATIRQRLCELRGVRGR